MTTVALASWIGAALLLQLAVGIGVGAWRRSRGGVRPMPAGPAIGQEAAGAWAGWRDFRVVRRQFEDRDHTQCSFHLAPADGAALPPFEPGQFLTFELPVPGPDPSAPGPLRTITRCYSLSDRPHPDHYRVTIKRIPPPANRPDAPPGLGSNRFHDHIGPGDVLKVKAPAGHFCIDPDSSIPAVLIAGGIGITPLLSMLTWTLAQCPSRPVHLYYGVRSSGDHAFRQTLEALAAAHSNLALHVVYSRPQTGDVAGRDYRHAGHVDLDLLRNTLPHGPHQFYVCGPARMMQTLVPALEAWGVAPADIRREAFGPASAPEAPAAAAPLEVHFVRSGRTLTWTGQDRNLLEFAERHGVPVDSGCRSGACGTCQTRLIDGQVGYGQKPEHDVPGGHCLLCVGRPQSPLTLEA